MLILTDQERKDVKAQFKKLKAQLAKHINKILKEEYSTMNFIKIGKKFVFCYNELSRISRRFKEPLRGKIDMYLKEYLFFDKLSILLHEYENASPLIKTDKEFEINSIINSNHSKINEMIDFVMENFGILEDEDDDGDDEDF